jgi:Tol biopolymer transport system component
MPSLPLGNTLRLGTTALVVGSLVACGGGNADETALAPASAAVDHPAAGRATTLAGSGLPAGSLQLVSTTPSGLAASASSATCGLSANGRLVLFFSDAANLVAGDTNGRTDVFLKNLDTGAVQRVTTQSNGAQIAAGGSCQGMTMTPDARLVALHSGGALFVKNTQTGQLVQASPAAGTVPQVDGFIGGVLSDDGRSVLFMTQPQQVYVGAYTWVNLVPARLMLRDLETGSLQTLATDNGVVADGQVIGSRFALSPDGTRVAFVSSSSSLVPGDNNTRPDVFVRELTSGSTTLVSSTSERGPSTAVQYWNPNFVSDSQVAFGTGGTSSLGAQGLYLKDLDTGALTLVLSAAEGGSSAVLSGDARRVVFQRAYNGVDSRVFLRDRVSGEEALVSASANGTANNNSATGAVISRDGSTVIFGSNARNLVSPRPPAGVFQVYAKTIGSTGSN